MNAKVDYYDTLQKLNDLINQNERLESDIISLKQDFYNLKRLLIENFNILGSTYNNVSYKLNHYVY